MNDKLVALSLLCFFEAREKRLIFCRVICGCPDVATARKNYVSLLILQKDAYAAFTRVAARSAIGERINDHEKVALVSTIWSDTRMRPQCSHVKSFEFCLDR